MMSHPAHPTLGQSSYPRLTRSLSAVESWGFGLTAHISWTALVPAIHAALGPQAIFVWIPAVIFGMLLNYQVKRLGMHFINVAGGTPNYATKLLQNYPGIACYAAIGYLLNWVSYLSVNTIVLKDLIKVNLEALGIACPEILLDIGFTLLPFIVAFSGTRALSILHLFFVIPAFGLLITFCVQGLGWLAFSDVSPGFFPSNWSSLGFVDWAKWFFFVTYATYSCETASSFVADSRQPSQTLRFLDVAAWMMPPIFLGGSWVMMRLATDPSLKDNAFMNLVAASQPFWGKSAAISVSFLLVAACLLGSATVVSNCPRILYQLALDKHISPVFSVVSRRGVFVPALTLTLVLCLIYLIWGDVARIVAVGNVGWFVSFMLLHLGLWLRRDRSEVLFPRISLAILLLEVVVLVVGGLAWGWLNLLIGLLFPIGVMGIDAVIRRVKFPPFHPTWWMRRYRTRSQVIIKDSVVLQVSILIFLLSSAVAVGWLFGVKLNKTASEAGENIFVALLMMVAFVGVAIACWTSLPQVVAIAEAREAAEHLFTVAQDGILVVDDRGIIQQANPATESFFGVNPSELRGNHLNKWLTALVSYPEEWTKRSEQTLLRNGKNKILEVSISDRPHQDFQEYVVILHDITQRKQAEQILRYSEAQLRQEAKHLASQLIHSEKMSSLGQLVAGVAHEINNPVNFIYGNITHANQYIEDLLKILQLYQQNYPNPVTEITKETEAIDLDFVIADLPNLLTSMTVGAERITEIVLSLRNFSRLDETEMKAVNIHEGIDNTLLILEHRLKAKSNSLTIDIIKEYGNLPLVECYAGQLNQVFMNLLANAIDALEEAVENGEWEVKKAALSTPQIKIHTQLNSEKQVVISIADNGTGIPENIQKHLFEPFFTTKPVGKGTGLGLSISYQIVTQKHLGQLQCISTQGEGTEFVVVIPLKKQAI
ncbi:amino acid permease [Nostoc sp. UCD121]|uniref:ATP-binding protein n=1 Tax=unclassified Nostoc TaxID=2593658 RepID=UPI0016248E04|nr:MULTISPECIES: ATP-binding protein [unclassified Nostoc]MBC1223356.1 amino acid permease [Nostoc sp. UCD120]MBC1275925.1 amino acid permease [Nostoc sp. UCD121]MBC1293635.1 amino acid permease [Nostoc sp. UCD122]